jgi:ATP-dependent helicase HrpB
VVPLALLDAAWLAGGRILMLEPRRLAARAAAWRMAELLGERVGETVGYRMRMDTRVGPRTRIEVVTEGVLTRMLQSDPTLDGVGLVIFDEFHERSLQADVGLALTLHARSILRPDLRVLVMSATLDGAPVAALLGGAPVISSEGRAYPVDVHYIGRRPAVRVEGAVAAAVRNALSREEGDLLVFLPGAGEIRRVHALLHEAALGVGMDVIPLHGNLPREMQDRALAPAAPGARKVVLATSIAETSLTIEGVGVVIDSGLARVPRFSPRSGMTRLETVRVSRASAEQRRGRAGRLGPGVCYRLWGEHEQAMLVAHAPPEILDADLAPVALDLAVMGVADPAELPWLDPPPSASFAQARELLAELGALDPVGRVTPHGRAMAELAMHPRLAHMVLRARELGLGELGCRIAALLAERDILRSDGGVPDADLRARLEIVADRSAGADASAERPSDHRVDRDALRRVRAQSRAWMEQLRVQRGGGDIDRCGLLLALAYPDRIARQRAGARGRYVLRNGTGAALAESQPLSRSAYLAVAELDGQRPESRIFLAAPLAEEEILAHFGDQIERDDVIAWDADARAVIARRRVRLGALMLADGPLPDPDPHALARALARGVAREGLGALPWSDGAKSVRDRIRFLHALDQSSWPDVSDESLAVTLDDWLLPRLHGATRLSDIRHADLADALRDLLPWDRRALLDELAPTHVTVPSGSRIPVDYSDPSAPVLAVRLQEMFGLAETPRIARGAVPLTLHLLSPAHRPVQVTRDLAGFWRSGYFDVRKDLRGRYPKHHWPEDPLQAAPTRRAKRKGE